MYNVNQQITKKPISIHVLYVVFGLLLFVFSCVIFPSRASAATPTVVDTSSGKSSANVVDTQIALPANVEKGDLLVVFFTKDGTAAPTSISGTGWTSFGAQAGSASYFIGYRKVADGNDSLKVNHASEGTSYIVYQITGFDRNTNPEAGTAATGSSVNPNPPSLNPSGWDTEDTLWIAAYAWDNTSTHSSYPTNYSTDQVTDAWSSSDGVGIAAATYAVSAASQDPGTATIGTSRAWIAQTFAVRGDRAPQPNFLSFSTFPYPVSTTSISMTSVTATDTDTPVEYYFSATSTGCGANYGTGSVDSGWQSSATYTETGLDPNKCYAYTVIARDSLGNKTATSSVSVTHTAQWNNTDWTDRAVMIINPEKIDDDLTDFPVAVDLSSMPASFWSGVTSSCGDIRVVASDETTELPREVVSCNVASSTGELNFRANILSSSTPSTFYIYWNGEASDYATADATFGAKAVWSNGYVYVLHLEEDPAGSAPQMFDSTNYGNDGTVSGTIGSYSTISGLLGNAMYFNGFDNIVTTKLSPNTEIRNTFSFGGFFKVETTHGIDTEATSGTGGTSGQKYLFGATSKNIYAGAGLSVGTNGISVYEHGNGYMPPIAVYSGTISAGWHHVMVVYENKRPLIYLDGVLVRTGLTSPRTYVYAPLQVGGGSYGYHTGAVDSVYLSDVERSAAWVRAEYENQIASTTFYSIYDEGSPTTIIGGGEVIPAIDLPPSSTATTTLAFTLETTSGTDTLTSVTVSVTDEAEDAIALVEIVNSAGTVVYGSTSLPTSATIVIPLSTNISVNTTPVEYKVRVTPRNHTDLIAPLGRTHQFTTTVSDWVGTNNTAGFSNSPSTIEVDNLSPYIQQPTGSWSSVAAAEQNYWRSVTYGNGLFVAVSSNGTNRVMTSPDGVTWTARSAVTDGWNSVTYGEGLFVAVAYDRVMTSPDGINWTARSAPRLIAWQSVTYGNGLFVAVGYNGGVMTSPDGINWTARVIGNSGPWLSVTYGNGLFVAVSEYTGDEQQVMTSPDGITWTSQSSIGGGATWQSVTYGNGLFVAVAYNSIMTSPDGITWTSRTSPSADTWRSVTYGNGLFVAVSYTGSNRLMTSPDGVTWTTRNAAASYYAYSVVYGEGKFVGVGSDGTNRVLISTEVDSVYLTAGDTEVTVSYNTPIDSDYHSTVVLMSTSTPVVDVPTEGVTYSLGESVGSSTVGCVNNAGVPDDWVDCIVSGLQNNTTYYFAVFARDIVGNYSPSLYMYDNYSIPGDKTVSIAAGLTTIPNTTIYPSGSATTSSTFSFTTDTGTTTIDSVTVSFGTATTGLALVEIVSEDESTVYGSTTNPTGSTAVITLDMNELIASTTETEYRIRVTPLSHAAMPVVPGGAYTINTRVTDWSGVGSKVRNDLSNTDITIDNESISSDLTLVAIAGNIPYRNWYDITYADGLFVAVSTEEYGQDVITSVDGLIWEQQFSPADSYWSSVTYGNGLFVAVGYTGTGNRVMTSPDGVTWTSRTSAADNTWISVTYGNGLFVAVACGVSSGSCNSTAGNRVMTSPDGITWTPRTTPADNYWRSVTYGNGLFVAVANSGTGNRVMTSPDGITWTARSAAGDNDSWYAVTYGNGLFVAVGDSGDRVMTSPDGITWTARSAAGDNDSWYAVTYGNGLFVAVANSGTGNRVMTSPDGITWTSNNATGSMYGVVYGAGRFVAAAGEDIYLSLFAYATTTESTTTIEYLTPADDDYHSTIILKGSSAITTAPTEGSTYNLNDTIGSATVVCVDTSAATSTIDSCEVNVGGGSTHFAIFHRDSVGNYSEAIVPDGSPAVLPYPHANLTSAEDYVFAVGQAATTLATTTITDASTATIASTTDIRITIATTTTDLRFDTQTPLLTFSGTASGKVSSSVSYEDDGATLLIDVTSDFAPNDTLIINGIAVGSFAAVSTTTSSLALYVAGDTTGEAIDLDTATMRIIGRFIMSDHTLGQVGNEFSYQDKNNETFFAFGLEADGEEEVISDLVITLSDIEGLDTNDLTDLRLYRDTNSDRELDGGDVEIDATGILTINGANGAITFSTDFIATSSADYIVIGDTANIKYGYRATFSLPDVGITVTGSTTQIAPLIFGSIDSVTHRRVIPSGGGGSYEEIGGGAPEGDGDVSGGDGDGGSGEAGEEADGENIATDPNFFAPTATGDIDNEWTNGSNALVSDGSYATAASAALKQSFNGFSFGIPGSNTIQGIEVKVDLSGTTAAGTIDIALSWDGGSSYTTAKATPTLSGTDVVYSVGGSADTWGRAWSVSDFSTTNFRLRVTAQPSANTIRLDALEVRVYHQASGGGGGGGGGEI